MLGKIKKMPAPITHLRESTNRETVKSSARPHTQAGLPWPISGGWSFKSSPEGEIPHSASSALPGQEREEEPFPFEKLQVVVMEGKRLLNIYS